MDRTVPDSSSETDGFVSLDVLGIGALEERIYRALLRRPGSTAAELADDLDLNRARLRRALAFLEHAGLVSHAPGAVTRYLPAAPDVGLEALVRDKEAELGRIRTMGALLMDDYREGQRNEHSELCEIVTGAEAVLRRFDQLQRSATTEIQVLDTPPYAGPAGPQTNDIEFDLLARGVTCKAIYDRAALERSPQATDAILRYVAAGEQARVISRLPLKLATFDRKLAFVPQSLNQRDVSGAIVVHPCSLLDVLLYVFDEMWERATPLTVDDPRAEAERQRIDDPTPDDRRLLTLLASGMKDQAIANHLGWSYRTTRRRIATLMESLDAETRFQAGLGAARRGWL
ncbi:helix-turn-helix domain-containing protein [Haloactinopolyspora sp.]|uniref:helix-turn-helix domain-containing protein n=1 Tax=Haloactinopolyspora sp. TaxID=1966353 RepID=UPI00261FA6CE|nr:helix-turn-helix domain-containing protein [Haloactinopolyspora sp.]